jgi:hypothetical protein
MKNIINKIKKPVVGIEINEILRARWIQFDRMYVGEFGEDGVPSKPYVYDFFGKYKWEDATEMEKELKEPEDMPENINPIEYHKTDEDTGGSNADFALFKTPKQILVTAREQYNRFMYQDYLFEIFGSAPQMYKNMDLDVKKFYDKYKDTVEFVIVSEENAFSISPTLFFMSKLMCRFKNYHFVGDKKEVWDFVDILITTDPEQLIKDKKVVKLLRPYNEDSYGGEITPVFQLNDLTENEEFEKLIDYKKPEQNEQ